MPSSMPSTTDAANGSSVEAIIVEVVPRAAVPMQTTIQMPMPAYGTMPPCPSSSTTIINDAAEDAAAAAAATNAPNVVIEQLPSVLDTPPPLYVQSEFDLRTVQIAAESAQLAAANLVQSDPNLGNTEHSGALFVEMVNPGTASGGEPSLAGTAAAEERGGAEGQHPSPSIVPCASTELPDRPPLSGGANGRGKTNDEGDGTTINRHNTTKSNTASFGRTCSGRTAAGSRKGRLRNQSELEVNAQHYKMQNVYKSQRERLRTGKLTDIDFEGILKIIGGCSTWQILIYLIISAHQMPHAMFNLSVVYFTYLPDHWCKLPGFSREYIENPENQIGPGWSWEKALDSGIAFPQARNSLRRRGTKHDQCAVYTISEAQLRDYLRMNFTEAVVLARERPPYLVHRCTEWEYDRRIMKESVVTQWDRVCDDNWSRAHVHLSYSLGYLVGCLMGGYISDRYGRKPAIYGFSILSTIFGFLLSFSREFEVFLVVRFLLAACNEAADLAAYVYCMEITGMQYRSIVGSLLQAPWACGYAFLALVAYLCRSWTSIQLITSTLHLFALFLIHHLPESPRWLIVTNRLDEAEKIIRKACHFNKSSLPSDLELVRHSEMRKWIKHNQRPHFLHSFKSPTMAFRNVIIWLVWIATALVYYGIVIALSDQSTPGRAMFVGNFFLNNAIAGAIELPTLMTCVFLLHKGRKWSQVISLISAGTLIFVAMCLSLREEMTFSLVFMLAGKACIQGAFNILYIFTSELYPTVIRNTAVGTCSMIARIGSAASGYIAILSDVTLPILPMAIFCIFSLFAGVLIYFLPETRDLPLPETMWDAVRMLNNTEHSRCVGGIIREEHDDDCYGGTGAGASGSKKRKGGGERDQMDAGADGGVEVEDYDDEEEDVFLYTNVSKR